MRDCENQVFTQLKSKILEQYPTADVASEYVIAPSRFPHISIVMADTYTSSYYLSNKDEEDYTVCMFEINIYSNKASSKKSECKAIAELISKELYSMNFIRTAQTVVPNLENNSIYRIVARYTVATDGKFFYRR